MAYKILVVDDDPALLEVTKEALKRKGYEVITAENGLEAMKIVKEGLPNLVLTDVEMPYMDGINLCIELKKIEYPGMRIIRSGRTQEHHGERLEQILKIAPEKTKYLQKPHSLDALFRTVNTLLDKKPLDS
ncbi:MAG: response regulator [Nanoarchaeota archaeon]|nr:response regulator [Nanoarchaeota archaeon]